MELLRRYRFLIIVYVLAVLAGAWEVYHADTVAPVATSTPLKAPETPADREVFAQVFPATVDAAFDAGMKRYFERDYPSAVSHFRKALATGVKTNEDLLWYYALALMHHKADDAEIDAAVANWRRNFPRSNKQDPYWFYALSLVIERGDVREIHAAVARWRQKSPNSPLPNPLEAPGHLRGR